MEKSNSTHISITVEAKDMLRELSELEDRSMRTVVARLIESALKKAKSSK